VYRGSKGETILKKGMLFRGDNMPASAQRKKENEFGGGGKGASYRLENS